jgi:hypothetical protein
MTWQESTGTKQQNETTTPRVKNLRFGVNTMTVDLADGCSIIAPLAWFPAECHHPAAAPELEASRSRSRHPLARY